MGLVDSAVKRGIQHPETVQFVKRTFQRVAHGDTFSANPDAPHINIPGWGVAILMVTAVSFMVFLIAVRSPATS